MAGEVTVAALALVAALVAAAPAAAHRLVVFAHAESGEVIVTAGFGAGRPARAGMVRVRDEAGRLLHALPLSRDGEARFPIGDPAHALSIEVDAGGGHDAVWRLAPEALAAGLRP